MYRITIEQSIFPRYLEVFGLTSRYFETLSEAEKQIKSTFPRRVRRAESGDWSHDPADVSRFRVADARGKYTAIVKDCGD